MKAHSDKIAFSLTAAVSALLGSCGAVRNDSPNIVYIFPDQYRASALGFLSEPGYDSLVPWRADPVLTPNIDSLARESLILTRAVSNCPLSSPHRGMLLSGAYPHRSGVELNCNSSRPFNSLREDLTCIGDVFSAAGYDCAYIGKLHADFPTPDNPQHPGTYVEQRNPVWDTYTPPSRRHGFGWWYSYGTFDEHKNPHYWDTEGRRYDPHVWSPVHEADKAIEFLRTRRKGLRRKPFLMMVAMNPPHSPYSSADDCMEEDYRLYADKPLGSLLVRANADTTMAKAPSVRYYFASVTGVDRQVGRILRALKEQGLDRSTIVVFTSDHGETMCSHSTDDPKNSPYTESVNVPFIIRYPGRIAPRADSLLLSSPDIMPTLLGLSGLGDKIPSTVQGTDWSSLFMGKEQAAARPKAVLYIKNTDGHRNSEGKVTDAFPVARGVITDRYTFVLTINRGYRVVETTLYDNLEDPYQLRNIPLSEHPDIVAELYAELCRLVDAAGDPWSVRMPLLPK